MERKRQVSPEQIEQERRLDLLSYLQQYEPHELVRVNNGVYSTLTNDSLKISRGKWFRWSTGVGGVSALDYLVKVRDMGFVDAVLHCLNHITGRTMLANSEYLVMLNQAPTDRAKRAELLHISDNQLSYITNAGFGRGLLKCGKSIVPFINNFPTHTKLYSLMSTKPGEIQQLLA